MKKIEIPRYCNTAKHGAFEAGVHDVEDDVAAYLIGLKAAKPKAGRPKTKEDLVPENKVADEPEQKSELD